MSGSGWWAGSSCGFGFGSVGGVGCSLLGGGGSVFVVVLVVSGSWGRWGLVVWVNLARGVSFFLAFVACGMSSG